MSRKPTPNITDPVPEEGRKIFKPQTGQTVGEVFLELFETAPTLNMTNGYPRETASFNVVQANPYMSDTNFTLRIDVGALSGLTEEFQGNFYDCADWLIYQSRNGGRYEETDTRHYFTFHTQLLGRFDQFWVEYDDSEPLLEVYQDRCTEVEDGINPLFIVTDAALRSNQVVRLDFGNFPPSEADFLLPAVTNSPYGSRVLVINHSQVTCRVTAENSRNTSVNGQAFATTTAPIFYIINGRVNDDDTYLNFFLSTSTT